MEFYNVSIRNFIIPTDELHHFQRGGSTTNQRHITIKSPLARNEKNVTKDLNKDGRCELHDSEAQLAGCRWPKALVMYQPLELVNHQ